jgi:hypothetical protein
MSRGPGVMQKYLVYLVSGHHKPVTFAELRSVILKADHAPPDHVLRPSVERSLRRALQSLVRDEVLIALGSGGRGDPHRYLFNPLIAALVGDEARFKTLCDAVEADQAGTIPRTNIQSR